MAGCSVRRDGSCSRRRWRRAKRRRCSPSVFPPGLPFALLIGTLNAWLGDAKINLATIGVLSWIGLGYAFKFLWSPLVDRVKLPLLGELGRRKSWIVLCQAVLIVSLRRPRRQRSGANIGWFAIFAVIGAFASATQDIAVDAWRIDVADERDAGRAALGGLPIRLSHRVDRRRRLRAAACRAHAVGHGLFRHGWLVRRGHGRRAHRARHAAPPRGVIEQGLEQPGEIEPQVRFGALAIVGACWVVGDPHRSAFFMISMLTAQRIGHEAAVGRRFHDARRALDHRRHGVRAAVRRRDGQLAEGAWPRRPTRGPAGRGSADGRR